MAPEAVASEGDENQGNRYLQDGKWNYEFEQAGRQQDRADRNEMAEGDGRQRAPYTTELVGESPMRYLAGWRIQLAKQLLRDGTNIAEVSERIGYESEAAFNRAFKRTTGSPPANWRRRVLAAMTSLVPILMPIERWVGNLFAS